MKGLIGRRRTMYGSPMGLEFAWLWHDMDGPQFNEAIIAAPNK